MSAGPVTAAGLPNFLPATMSGTLTLQTSNVSPTYPLVATAASGWSLATGTPVDTIGVSTGPLAWPGLAPNRAAATPNFLYATIAGGVLTPGSTLLPPIYQHGGTPAVTSGQFTFNIAEMRGYLGNGTSAPPVNLVMMGEAVTGSSAVLSTVAYAYNGYYDSGWTATLSNAGVTTNCNIGAEPSLYATRYVICCTAPDLGYSIGDILINSAFTGSTNSSAIIPYATRNAVSTPVLANHAAIVKTTGNMTAQANLASWKYKLVAERGW